MTTSCPTCGQCDQVLIWSVKDRLWYRPGGKGYTSLICRAGRYWRCDAEREIQGADDLVIQTTDHALVMEPADGSRQANEIIHQMSGLIDSLRDMISDRDRRIKQLEGVELWPSAEEVNRLKREISRRDQNARNVLDSDSPDPVYSLACLYLGEKGRAYEQQTALTGFHLARRKMVDKLRELMTAEQYDQWVAECNETVGMCFCGLHVAELNQDAVTRGPEGEDHPQGCNCQLCLTKWGGLHIRGCQCPDCKNDDQCKHGDNPDDCPDCRH